MAPDSTPEAVDTTLETAPDLPVKTVQATPTISDDSPDVCLDTGRRRKRLKIRSNESMSDDHVLQTKHKIFLSHSEHKKTLWKLCVRIWRSAIIFHFSTNAP